MSRGRVPRPRGRGRSLRRFVLLLTACTVVIVLGVAIHRSHEKPGSFPTPSKAVLSGLSLRQRMVAIAESQIGYGTDPPNSYCDKFSAYWKAGTPDCPSSERAEEWCADFAAWVWQKAGVQFTYGYGRGDINGGAVSFYEWGLANDKWHSAKSRYVPSPGDVAVYGLTAGPFPSAVHVAVVTAAVPGARGPDVVNGDGDRTGFSVVETGTTQLRVDPGHKEAELAGYVSPPPLRK